jgi:type I restriction enzyme, S subunit
VSDLPEGWVQISFGDLGEWRGGGTPSKSNSSYWRNGTIPWVSPKDMKRDKIDSAEDMITQEGIENSSANVIPSGSLLIVTRSGILKHSLPVAANTIPVAINQDIKALTLLPGFDADFFRYQIYSAAPKILSDTVRSGTTVESVDFKSLKNFKVLVPPASEQQRIAQRLDALLLRTASVRSAIENIPALLDSYRTSLLAIAFDGGLTKQWRADRGVSKGCTSLIKVY